MTIVGQRIKRYRELKGISQDKIALAMEKSSKSVISNWETGKNEPSLTELMKLAELLGATVAQLVGEAPMLEEPRENYVMVKKDDLIALQQKALQLEEDRIKDLQAQLDKALNPEAKSEEQAQEDDLA